MSIWLLIVVLHLGWGGNDVKFHEFPTETSCASVRDYLTGKLPLSTPMTCIKVDKP